MIFNNPEKTIEERIVALIKELTVDEKIGFLTGRQAPVERLGIKERYIGTEYARGWSSHDESQFCTVLPQTIGMASTFDKDLIYRAGQVCGRESRAYYNSVNKSLIGFGPTVDLERDIRWGRHEEGYGEDPCLTGIMATSYTKGIVGKGKVKQALPLLKHFVCNNTETHRDSYNAEVPEKLLQEYYYEVFRKPIEEGGAFGVMAAYNKLNGFPGLVNPVNREIVKNKWGGKLVCSDGGAFSQVLTSHQYTKSHAETLAIAIKAGANVFLDKNEDVVPAAKEALAKKLITEDELNQAISGTLYLRFLLGEFDGAENNPYENVSMDMVNTVADKALALKMSEEQIILLENNGILPLVDEKRSVAVIGSQADENFLDWYTGASSYDITVKDGLEEGFKNAEIKYDSGRDVVLLKNAKSGKYLFVEDDGCVRVCADKEHATQFEQYDWGWGYVNYKCIANGKMLQEDQGILKATAKDAYMWFVRPILRPHEVNGGKGITWTGWQNQNVVMNGEEIIFTTEVQSGENDVFEIEVISDGNLRCKKLAEECDLVIVCNGNHPTQVGREGYDREEIVLPPRQETLVRNSLGANKNTILLMVSSYPYAIDEFKDECAAVIYTTHAGPELGRAVANILSGKANPSGKTACTWYKKDFDFPSIYEYDISKSKMTYLYMEKEPLYPFGYGLSYSKFEYSDFKVWKNVTDNGKIELKASVSVKNDSAVDGAEVVQLYVKKTDSQYIRPVKKLCGFERIEIPAGKTRCVEIDIDVHYLECFENGDFVLEKGIYKFAVGTDSKNLCLEEQITL
ncbi:MAG: glycoside hydrolase family 3 C-terminal domain-containing protein [Treponema sp.]|nr:glycoside hydrolase family 3 C-terminal domain-containing protein [Treponema sp.]